MVGPAVLVTGLGMTTPLGGDVASSWAAMLDGCSGVDVLRDRVYAGLPVRIAARATADPARVLGRVAARRWDRSQLLALVAAREAWADAGFTGPAPEAGLDPSRVAAVVGSGIGGIGTILEQYDVFRTRGWQAVSPYTVTMTMPNAAAAAVGLELVARAGSHAPTSACATGAEAIALAVDLIRLGRTDVAVAGGTEAAIDPFTIAGFAAMRALSRRNDAPQQASRPFDVNRDGFVLGEGAGALVLESAAHARGRGASAYAELAGIGVSNDAYHITRSDPSAAGPEAAMRLALTDAAADPADVVHVNAHATSTPVGDAAEARAIRAVLGGDVLVTAPKSMTGHLLGASGAMEAIATVLTVHERVAPPTVNLDDADVDLHIATGKPHPLPDEVDGRPVIAVSNSFGFGGHNVTLAFRAIAPDLIRERA